MTTTGWPPGMLQDDSRELSRWLANRPGALYQLSRTAMNTEDKLREALEQIANFSDVEMGDGDGARKVALEALAATAAPSEPVAAEQQEDREPLFADVDVSGTVVLRNDASDILFYASDGKMVVTRIGDECDDCRDRTLALAEAIAARWNSRGELPAYLQNAADIIQQAALALTPQPSAKPAGVQSANKPHCRDCADFGPICPNSGEPCAKPAGAAAADSEFKNFHRLLCERFGYRFDPVGWKRDQASLIEYIDQLGDAREHLGFEKASDKSDAHFCGYARVRDGKYELAGMRDCPIMRDGELHPIYTGIPDLASNPPAAHAGLTDADSPEAVLAEAAKHLMSGRPIKPGEHLAWAINEAARGFATTPVPVKALAPEGYARDAARYRWLRDRTNWDVLPVDKGDDLAEWKCLFHSPYGMHHEADDNLDQAIDSAMASAPLAAQCAAGAKPAGVDFGDDSFRRAAPPAAHGAPVMALAPGAANLPPFPWKARNIGGICEVIDAAGNIVIAWMGLDDSRKTFKKRQAITRFIAESTRATPPAAQGAPVMAEAASLETALVTQFGSTTEYDELICAIWAAQPHYFRNREQSLEKARGLLAAATRKGQGHERA